MTISEKYKLGFIHIPKCGGASIKTLMWQADRQVFRIGGYHAYINKDMCEKYPNIYKFSVVRNSWEAIISFYRYFVERKRGDISFDWYVRNHVSKRKAFPHQLQYLGGKDNILVDQIIDFDNLEEEFREICSVVGMPCGTFPKSHNTKYIEKRKYYTPELVDFVYDLCKEDIECFNFKYRNV